MFDQLKSNIQPGRRDVPENNRRRNRGGWSGCVWLFGTGGQTGLNEEGYA